MLTECILGRTFVTCTFREKITKEFIFTVPIPYAVVRLDGKLMEQLRTYGRHTGVSAKRCVDEAVANWLKTVAPARLEYLGISHREIKRKPLRLKA